MLNPKGNYAMYLRKSRADAEAEARGQFETLAKHEQILTDLAKRHGIKVSRIFREIVSGDTIADRPQVQQLLKDVRAGIFDGVLVTEISRLARGRTADQGEISEAFSLNGTLIITPSKVYDPMDDADETFFDFELFMARQEYKFIRKRMKAGKERSRQNGNFLNWRAPYGYDKVEKTLVPNKDLPFVTMLLTDFADGTISVSDAIRRFWAYTGTQTWSYQSVRYLLCNAAYAGFSEINMTVPEKYTKEDGTIGIRRVRNRQPDLVKGNWEGCIDFETHLKCKARFGTMPRNTEKKELKNPFAGVVRCARCGRIMCYQFGNRANPIIRHKWGTQNIDGCKCACTEIEDMMQIICNAMEEKLQDTSVSLVDGENEVTAEPLIAEKEAAEKKRDALYAYLENGIYTPDEFQKRRAVYNEQIAALEEQIAEIQGRENRIPVIYSITTKDAINGLRWKGCPAELRNSFLKSVFTSIDYWREDTETPPVLTYHWRF